MSERRVSLTFETAEFDENSYLLTIKDAPDILINRCTQYVGEDGNVHEFNQGVRVVLEGVKDKWSSEGKRVIALAPKIISPKDVEIDPTDNLFEKEAMEHVRSGLILVGLIGIVDPPRDEIPQVIRILRQAGIRICMVTGDSKLTTPAIAQAGGDGAQC